MSDTGLTGLEGTHNSGDRRHGVGHKAGRNHLDPAFRCQIARQNQTAMIDECQDDADDQRDDGRSFGDLLAKGN